MVYEVELAGMVMTMGLHFIRIECHNRNKCVVNVDNQAALVVIKSEVNKSRHHLAAEVLEQAKKSKNMVEIEGSSWHSDGWRAHRDSK